MNLRLVQRRRWSIFAVCNARGDCPLLDFLFEGSIESPDGTRAGKGWEAKEKVRMLARLQAVAEAGPPRNVDICHRIEPDIWQFEAGRIRVLWFYDEDRLVILSHGFMKSSPKTPETEKRIAREALARYKQAKRAGTIKVLEEKRP